MDPPIVSNGPRNISSSHCLIYTPTRALRRWTFLSSLFACGHLGRFVMEPCPVTLRFNPNPFAIFWMAIILKPMKIIQKPFGTSLVTYEGNFWH